MNAKNTKVAAPELISTVKAETKADKARAIFNECYAQSPIPQRKDILARMQKEADLTPAGSATYLQNFKRVAGLVASKAPAVAATA